LLFYALIIWEELTNMALYSLRVVTGDLVTGELTTKLFSTGLMTDRGRTGGLE
jgi:hypothetical protein